MYQNDIYGKSANKSLVVKRSDEATRVSFFGELDRSRTQQLALNEYFLFIQREHKGQKSRNNKLVFIRTVVFTNKQNWSWLLRQLKRSCTDLKNKLPLLGLASN